jgi:hypothetical protein
LGCDADGGLHRSDEGSGNERKCHGDEQSGQCEVRHVMGSSLMLGADIRKACFRMCRINVPVSVAVRSPSGKLMMKPYSEGGIAWPLVWIESSLVADHNTL